MKKLIFDFDGTILPFLEEYMDTVDDTLKEYGIVDKELSFKIKQACDSYEKHYTHYRKKDMLEHFSKEADFSLPEDFMDRWLSHLKNCAPSCVEEELISTLEYLSSKYELVILTNWFYESQEARLKKAGLDKYFQEIIACDEEWMKPHKEAFLRAVGKEKIEECLMIGDDIKADIEGASQIGLPVLFLNRKKIDTNYPSIFKFEELKERL